MSKFAKGVLGAALFTAALVALSVFLHGYRQESLRQERWLTAFLQEAADYEAGYDEWPTRLLPWEEWYCLVMDGLWLPENEDAAGIPLGSLADSYVKLSTIHLKEPENQDCRKLYEKLRPYYEQAFRWGPDAAYEECITRLQSLPAKEISGLCEEVQALYESTGTGLWLGTVSDSDLQLEANKER